MVPKQTSQVFFLSQTNDKGDNSTEIKVSDTRMNPTYMLYYTISQIFHPTLTTGILPMAALIYMNASIFFGKICQNGKT